MTARPHLSEEQRQQRELNARHDLEQLVEYLVGAARSAWQDQRLWGHGDRARYYGRSVDLVTTVDKLLKMILEQPDADVRADRLSILHDALEAAAIIGGCLKTPAAGRQRTPAAEEAKLGYSRRQDEVLVEAARLIRQKQGGSKWSRLKTSHEYPVFHELLDAQGLRLLKQPTIYDRLRPLWPRIVSSGD
jgi:hypothetical protein